jgi:predicted transposase/invertase (TIGR01784 family)
VNIINNPHDKYFKKVFEDKEVTKDFLMNFLPKEIINIIDLNSLDNEKESFIEKELEGLYSDALFKTVIKGKEAYIYFLIEHKSYIAKRVALQLLEYIIKIWKLKSDDENSKLPLVIPFVIYHGKQKWKVDLNLLNLISPIDDLPKNIIKYIPNYEYIMCDLSSYGKEEIEGNVRLQIFSNILKVIHDNDENKIIKVIIESVKALEKLKQKDTATEYFEIFIRYIMNVRDMNFNDVYKAIKTISHERSEIIMTLADKFKKEGIIEGKKEGIIKGKKEGKIETAREMKKMGADLEFISKATKIPIEELQKELSVENLNNTEFKNDKE